MTPEEIVKRDLEKAAQRRMQRNLDKNQAALAEIENIVRQHPFLKEYPMGAMDGRVCIELPECTTIFLKTTTYLVFFITEEGSWDRIEDAVYSANRMFKLLRSKENA